MTIRQNMSTGFTITIAILAFGFTAGCEAPKGVDLQAKDWELHVPIGTAKFETESGGFSLSKLKANEIKEFLGNDFEGEVYDGKVFKGKVYKGAADTSTKRIFVRAGNNTIGY